MVFSILGAAALASAPVHAPFAQDVNVEFVDHTRRDAWNGIWQRYDIRFTNDGSEARTLSLCPGDADLYFKDSRMGQARLRRLSGDALAFDGDDWTFNCSHVSIDAGKSTVLSLYFRLREPRARTARPILFETSLGNFFVKDGSIVALGEGDEDKIAI